MPFPQTGDIILMDAKGGVRELVNTAQGVIRGKRAIFSHAAVAIDSEVYVDSVTKRGVGIARWEDLNPSKRIAAFRHRPSGSHSHDRIGVMLEHYGLAYNRWFALKNHPIFKRRYENAFYCSEFVAQVFTREELGIPDDQALLLPVDLESLAEHPDWDNVTHIYQPILGTSPAHPTGNTGLFETQGEINRLLRKKQADDEEFIRKLDALKAAIDASEKAMRRANKH